MFSVSDPWPHQDEWRILDHTHVEEGELVSATTKVGTKLKALDHFCHWAFVPLHLSCKCLKFLWFWGRELGYWFPYQVAFWCGEERFWVTLQDLLLLANFQSPRETLKPEFSSSSHNSPALVNQVFSIGEDWRKRRRYLWLGRRYAKLALGTMLPLFV